MPLLVIVRHGQASFGSADYDVLSPVGRQQALQTAGALRDAGLEAAHIVTGSLRRQRGTADAIADAFGLSPTIDERWNEYDADSVLAHHSESEQRLEHPEGPAAMPSSPREFQRVLEGALEAWITAGADSPTSESWPAFNDRVRAALQEAGTAHSGTTVIVTSGGVIGALAVSLIGVDPISFPRLNRVTINCGITRVIIGSAGTTLVSFNEQGHLSTGMRTYR
ncbi:MAG TPA: histidine phosphatase family protein [Solirubrobacteraceae bacterium]|nr:histidine phosphatase family protein [Solirubrobacteraceae bacterium]